eukprot:6833399-Prorocentrum_lima.AAC.1
MTSSLVGSEMCIRDSVEAVLFHARRAIIMDGRVLGAPSNDVGSRTQTPALHLLVVVSRLAEEKKGVV